MEGAGERWARATGTGPGGTGVFGGHSAIAHLKRPCGTAGGTLAGSGQVGELSR